MTLRSVALAWAALCFLAGPAGAQTGSATAMPVSQATSTGRRVDFTDLMKVRQIGDEVLADDGAWLAYTSAPDRGDGEVVVRSTSDEGRHVIPLGSDPVFSSDGRWVAARVNPSLEAQATAPRARAPRRGMALLDVTTGEMMSRDDVQSFAFSQDGAWLAYQRFAPRDGGDGASRGDEVEEAGASARRAPGGENPSGAGEGAMNSAGDGDPDPSVHTTLVLHRLSDHDETDVEHVEAFAFDHAGRFVAYTVEAPGTDDDGLWIRSLVDGSADKVAAAAPGSVTSLTWQDGGASLAFVATEPREGAVDAGTVWTWSEADGARVRVGQAVVPAGWMIPRGTDVEWSDDGRRLFFGWRPVRADELEAAARAAMDAAAGESFDPYDTEAILADRGVDVWNGMDPHIIPQQKVTWDRESERTYLALYDLDRDGTLKLGAPDLPSVRTPHNDAVALALTDAPYQVEATWMGGQSDVYLVRLSDGQRTRVAERVRNGASLSPGGRYVAWYDDGHYHLFDREDRTTRNVTASLGVPIADEDHDYPDPAPGYGVAGWLEGDGAVLIYDKYDIWVVPTDEGEAPWTLSGGIGRSEKRIFRIVETDGDREDAIGRDEKLLLSAFDDERKTEGFYRAWADRRGVTRLMEENRLLRFRGKADDADVVLFSREDYDEFPDLWVADDDLDGAHRVTDANPGLFDRYAWGTSELVEWKRPDGQRLQGVVIKPNDYQEGRRYPVLIYYYRFFSQRLHEFNDPSVNHRPSFPVYASDGYVVFLPDVRFEVGRPGATATESVVSGVRHLIDIGLADPDAIALHGHSWSGYQTAFMVTQTNLFTTAVAGAPVANMTSAYSGIRLGSGVARQFQYEMGQSRLSGSLWEARDEYIANSPVFFADRIETPMLLLHGDADDAVPWEQSIEMYMAMRRLGKEVVLLEYRGEPHHPQRYANKLDWAIKMKEWIDHYLKGAPAPAWMSAGLSYSGK